MYRAPTVAAWLPLLAAMSLAWPAVAVAQGTGSIYQLNRIDRLLPIDTGVSLGAASFSLGPVRLAPSLQLSPGGMRGASLSLDTGGNWFAQVGIGRIVVDLPAAGPDPAGLWSLGGGYRWGDGQILSLQLVQGTRQQRLGLAVSYDWPRYFVRLDYANRLQLTPLESLRLSAGVRF